MKHLVIGDDHLVTGDDHMEGRSVRPHLLLLEKLSQGFPLLHGSPVGQHPHGGTKAFEFFLPVKKGRAGRHNQERAKVLLRWEEMGQESDGLDRLA